ncbi:glycosyltransferase [Pelomonas sp. V22]|uniref:glycosyltransferase n=1 Tax=Pelomonas sp. V22 TaxID=2822139 RepID=UPI0024A8FF19|nr:glycosyltransferase [Pelomonas sp. V22]MDI4631852.1 glycosyltransferase [Pelomonas sp. V22]
MKIAHVLLTHRFAGSERHAVELANAQAQQHEVWMILHRRAAEQRPDAIAHRLDPRVRVILVGGWSFLAALAARRALRSLPLDVAHAHLSWACRALQGLRGHGLRVATLHIDYKPQQHRSLDALIAIAPWQMAHVPAEQRSHCTQIDNWTVAGPFDPAARQRLRRELGFADSDFVIGALGRVEASKGLDLLVEAFGQARPPGCRLVIAGHGRDWERLRRLAPPEVLMPGFVSHPQQWFSAFDAFVSAAHSEPFGLVFLEAMAAGLPVLATASQGAQLLAGTIQRPLLPVADVPAMAQALAGLAEERPARRSYDLTPYRIERATEAVEAFYRQQLTLVAAATDP